MNVQYCDELYNIHSQRMLQNNDIDFYQRKILRLEQDLTVIHDQLNRTRNRLRIAQDFQIKYHILLKTSEAELARAKQHSQQRVDLQKQEAVAQALKELTQKHEKQVEKTKEDARAQFVQQLSKMKTELQSLRFRYEAILNKKEEMDIFHFKLKKLEQENLALEDKLRDTRQVYQKERDEEVAGLKTQLSSNFREKLQGERQKYQEIIKKLQAKLAQLQLKQDQDHFSLPNSNNNQLLTLQEFIEEQSQRNQHTIAALEQSLEQKNKQIKDLLKARQESETEWRAREQTWQEEKKKLERKRQREFEQHQSSLVEAVNRTKARAQTIQKGIQGQLDQQKQQIQTQRRLWDKTAQQNAQELATATKLAQQKISQLQQQHKQLRLKIRQLHQRLKDYQGQRDAQQTKLLIGSLADIDLLQLRKGSYEDGIVFLQQLLKKKQRNHQDQKKINETLKKQLGQTRHTHQIEIEQWRNLLKAAKAERRQEKNRLQGQIQELHQQLVESEKAHKKEQHEWAREKTQFELEVHSLKINIQNYDLQLKRIVQSRKRAEGAYRAQREKSLGSFTDLNTVKKQRWLQLQKAKNDLQAVYREKQHQLSNKHQQEMTTQANRTRQLEHQKTHMAQHNELLQKEISRLKQELGKQQGYDKRQDIQKKLATLDLEIAFTQNLYRSLVPAYQQGNLTRELSPLPDLEEPYCLGSGGFDGEDG